MSDDELEKAIDSAGREAVFNRARDLGWCYPDAPPKFVWWGIVSELWSRSLTAVVPEPHKTL